MCMPMRVAGRIATLTEIKVGAIHALVPGTSNRILVTDIAANACVNNASMA